MAHRHQRTLDALFAHPIRRNLPLQDVEALLRQLGADVQRLDEHRLQCRWEGGDCQVLHAAPGEGHHLDGEGVLHLRQFLLQACRTPNHPLAGTDVLPSVAAPRVAPQPLADTPRRLVLQLDHHAARLWWLKDDGLDAARLEPHGVWSSGQRLIHRHDRDLAGQRAPLDFDYLNQLAAAVLEADRVLLLGHGHGRSDMRQLLRDHLSRHHPEALERLETLPLDDAACSEAELLALARAHFGQPPARHRLRSPGLETKPASGSLSATTPSANC